MNIKVAVLEDEQVHRETLQEFLHQWERESKNAIDIFQYACSEYLLSDWQVEKVFDVAFLDIVMPGNRMNGMEVAHALKNKDCEASIIFTTSVADFMQDGYRVQAVRYLMKPLNYEDIKECMDEVLWRLLSHKNTSFVIQYKGRTNRIFYKDVLYFSNNKHNIDTHTRDQVYTHHQGFQDFLESLPPEFCQCNRGLAVNLEAIYGIAQKEITLMNKEKLPISDTYLATVKDLYIKHFR